MIFCGVELLYLDIRVSQLPTRKFSYVSGQTVSKQKEYVPKGFEPEAIMTENFGRKPFENLSCGIFRYATSCHDVGQPCLCEWIFIKKCHICL